MATLTMTKAERERDRLPVSALLALAMTGFTAILTETLPAGLLPHIAAMGEYFRAQLCELAARFNFIKEVRGYGLMIGVELSIPGKEIVNQAMQEGLLMNCTHDTVLRFLPPYIITEAQVDEAVAILDRVFRRT